MTQILFTFSLLLSLSLFHAGVNAFNPQIVLDLTNAFRAQNGLKPVCLNQQLMNAAQSWANQNPPANNLHGDFASRVPQYYSIGSTCSIAENAGQGQKSERDIVTAWINSPPHRANLLLACATHMGVGYNPNSDIWIQDFGGDPAYSCISGSSYPSTTPNSNSNSNSNANSNAITMNENKQAVEAPVPTAATPSPSPASTHSAELADCTSNPSTLIKPTVTYTNITSGQSCNSTDLTAICSGSNFMVCVNGTYVAFPCPSGLQCRTFHIGFLCDIQIENDSYKCFNEGELTCDGGINGGYKECVYGVWKYRDCGPGTFCQTLENGITCGWPKSRKLFARHAKFN